MIPWLRSASEFPPVNKALTDPNGLLCVGGNLAPETLLAAYSRGIFPWYSAGEPILWWSPDPRMVLFPDEFKLSRSLAKTVRRGTFTIRFNSAFREVLAACAAPRTPDGGTWITSEMQEAYYRLHQAGYAHSVESWLPSTGLPSTEREQLVGGLYGVALGKVFFGESMFSRVTDASKVALVALVDKLRAEGFQLIDCQQQTRHLASLGARPIPRSEFTALLERWIISPPHFQPQRDRDTNP
ncbi:MAG: leucyl/phenylalanyl-tRNA--protein transferase [Betaproteobacteria bacterium]|nr:leucyl/phenylalanyl-tRNA--protein transferase [Betaproteobacteria bacterium]